MNWTLRRSAAALLLGILFACDTAVWAQTTPTLQGTASRKAHGAAGTFDLPLGGNAAPVVHNDTGSTAPGVAIQINVLSNDTDPDHDPLSVVAFSQGGNGSVACLANGNCTYTPNAGFSGVDAFTYTVSDGRGKTAVGTVTITVSNADPTLTAPPIDPTVATTVDQGAIFLYTGANPVQTGVAPGTIQATRASILRGKVTLRNGNPLPGAVVTINGNAQFGQTISRSNGAYDMAVNGARLMIVNIAAPGFLPAQRQVFVPWQGYVHVPDVALIPVDSVMTTITANFGVMQVHRASLATDGDGSRKATVLFPAGTTATMVTSGGPVPLATLDVRATEYTVGANGPSAMPAQLPPASAYTYAVEYSADQAISAGATMVTFSQPLPTYVENFLNFPVGTTVPSGYYDRAKGQWIPAQNGLVIKIVSITAGTADLDVTGDGIADTGAALTNLGITLAEQQKLATLYAAGQSLWRVPIDHFTPWDSNWPYSLPPDAQSPAQNGANATPDEPEQDTCDAGGSIIECQNQVLAERVGIVGTPYTLNYRSDRVPGHVSVLNLNLGGPTVPASLLGISVQAVVGGQLQTANFPASPNQTAAIVANHLDAYGRPMQGAQPITATIDYSYQALYNDPGAYAINRFGGFGTGVTMGANRSAGSITVSQTFQGMAGEGVTDARAFGLGGWMLSTHHFYDLNAHVMHLGYGGRSRAKAVGNPIVTIGGTGAAGITGNGILALQATIDPSGGIAIGPDGTLYFCNFSTAAANVSLVRRITTAGIIATIAGNPTFDGFNGDNILATNAHLSCDDLAVGPDFSVYVSDLVNRRVRRITQAGIITTVAGNGTTALGAEGVLATQTSVLPQRIAIGPEGNLYIAEDTSGATLTRIRRVSVDGVINTLLTCATSSCGTRGMATGPDGSLYYVELQGFFGTGGTFIKRLQPSGATSIVAGGGGPCASGVDPFVNGLPAVQAKLCRPFGLTIGPDETLYFADADSPAIAQVKVDGIMNVFAGIANGSLADNILARDAKLDTVDMKLGPDGGMYLSTRGTFPQNAHIRKISPSLPGFVNAAFIVASRDGREVYSFDAQGRHLNTRHGLTGTIIRTFTYDAAGRLAQMTEKTGGTDNVTTIQHDASGNPVSIVGPFGQVTTLSVDANGFLASIKDPANETMQLASTASGLLTGFTDPRGKTSIHVFDAQGRLLSDTDAIGGSQTLTRTTLPDQYQVNRTTGQSRVTSYTVEDLPGNLHQTTDKLPDGTQYATAQDRDGGVAVGTDADGSVTTLEVNADPRFGLQAPLPTSVVLTVPSTLTLNSSQSRIAVLSNASDPLSLTSLTDTSVINGRTGTRAFTAAAGALVTTTPVGRTSTLTIDSFGRPTSSQLSGLNAATFTYDNRGRIATIAHGSGANVRSASISYGGNGYVQSITDPLGRTAQWSYDAAGRVASKTFPDGRVVNYQYDAAGNVLSVTPPGRPAHAFEYSDRDELTKITPPPVAGTGPTTYTYDLDRDLATVSRPDGLAIALGFDAGGRLVTRGLLSSGVVTSTDTLTYDGAGRVASVAAGNGVTTTYNYDGPLPTGETWTGPIAGSVTRSFDSSWRTVGESVNGANSVAFQYDDDDLLVGAGALTIARNAQNGLPTGTTLGVASSSMAFDGFADLSSHSVSANGTGAFNATFVRDALGRIVQKTETVGGVTDTYGYSYDLAGRLTGVSKNAVNVESYGYDSNGNRTSATVAGNSLTATYDNQDRLLQYGTALFTYNAAGDLATKSFAAQTTSYSYDPLGSLRTVTLPGGSVITYILDGNNRLVGKRLNGILAKGFLYGDLARPIAELDGAGAVVSRFVYAGGHAPAYMIKQGVAHRIVTDQIGSVRLVIDSVTGAIVQRIDYDTFGNVIQDTNPGLQPFGFAGGLHDADTNLIHLSRRDYDPASGRWTAKDALGFDGGESNLYLYAGGDPVNAFDPGGDVTLDAASFPAGTEEQQLLANLQRALTKLSGTGKNDEWSKAPRKLRQQRDSLDDDFRKIWKNSVIRYDPNCTGATGNFNENGGADIVLGPWFLQHKFLWRGHTSELEKVILHEYLHDALDKPFQFHGNPDRNDMQHGFIDQVIQFNLGYKGSPNPGAP